MAADTQPTKSYAAKLYYCAAGIGSTPTWTEITEAENVTVNVAFSDSDVTTRGAGGAKQQEPVLLDFTIDFNMPYIRGSLHFLAIEAAAMGRTLLGIAAMSNDITVSGWSETHIIADAAMTNTYLAALSAVVRNPINNASFKGCAAGEAKFLGVEGAQRHKGGDWELNFKFAASPNSTSITIDVFTSIVKKGWEYLWCYYEETTGMAGSTPVREVQVRDVVVNQVYGTSDFSTLGIGTT